MEYKFSEHGCSVNVRWAVLSNEISNRPRDYRLEREERERQCCRNHAPYPLKQRAWTSHRLIIRLCIIISSMQIDWFPLWLSLRVAGIATVISLIAGVGIAYVLANSSFRGREVLDALVTLPLVLPPTVLGYYLLVLLGRNTPLGSAYEWLFGAPLVFTWQAAVVAALLHSAPLLIKSARAALESVDHTYERAARSLGASEVVLFLRITLPLAWRSILAAVALCFARALGDFGATIMVAGNIPGRTQTVAVAIYDAVESGQGHVARVLVLAISAVTIIILSLANLMRPPVIR